MSAGFVQTPSLLAKFCQSLAWCDLGRVARDRFFKTVGRRIQVAHLSKRFALAHEQRYRASMVSAGQLALSECFGDVARPFRSAGADLAAAGHRFHTIVVDGRSGTETNAAEIALYFAEQPADAGMPRVLVGYSKGASDILQFLVDYPIYADRVDAVVSVAGSVRGSPLAQHYEGVYDLLVAHFPMGHCDAGDGELVHSLRSDLRTTWLNENPLPAHPRYYSVTAFTTQNFVARGLKHTWKSLLQHDRRNDGQLLPRDTLIPGSTLLGYVNADHWAVALDLESEHEIIAHRQDRAAFPRTVLIEAILDYVGADLR